MLFFKNRQDVKMCGNNIDDRLEAVKHNLNPMLWLMSFTPVAIPNINRHPSTIISFTVRVFVLIIFGIAHVSTCYCLYRALKTLNPNIAVEFQVIILLAILAINSCSFIVGLAAATRWFTKGRLASICTAISKVQ
jgi:hypothetical protein